MNTVAKLVFVLVLASACATTPPPASPPVVASGEWTPMFDGTSLAGWRANENKETFKVEDGKLIAHGPRSHLFYVGRDGNARFSDFEWKCDVMTKAGANSGMYFHTAFQETGWPEAGYEVQVNNTHKDPKKTGGLYAVKDVFEAPAKDDQWFTQHVIVRGKQITVKVNDKVTADYSEPADAVAQRPNNMKGRLLGSGTVAIQGHDPESVVYYRNCMIKAL